MGTRKTADMVVSDNAMFALWQESRSDMNRQFTEIKNLLSEHVRDDTSKFSQITSRLDAQDRANAEEHGATKAKAKVWALTGSGAAVVISVTTMLLKHYHWIP